MKFNTHQIRIFENMLIYIEDYDKRNLTYSEMVGSLEGSLDAGEFRDQEMITAWYDCWGPLEIERATKGNSVDRDFVKKYITQMRDFICEKIQ